MASWWIKNLPGKNSREKSAANFSSCKHPSIRGRKASSELKEIEQLKFKKDNF